MPISDIYIPKEDSNEKLDPPILELFIILKGSPIYLDLFIDI